MPKKLNLLTLDQQRSLEDQERKKAENDKKEEE